MQSLRALVVHESMFGNTARVAEAVAQGLRLEGVDADLVEVGSAPTNLAGLALVVVGAPTHAFSLSRPSSREDAVRQGAAPEQVRLGIREWLADVHPDAEHPPLLAAFDTRATKVRWLPQAAGPSAVRLAHKHGLMALTKPRGFLVSDIRGPLVEGELERAMAWGRELGRSLTEQVPADAVSQS